MQRSNKTQLAFFFTENLHNFTEILSCFQLPFHTVIFLIWPLTPSDVATPLYYPLNIAPLWSFIYLIILFIFRVKIEATGQSMPHNLFSA